MTCSTCGGACICFAHFLAEHLQHQRGASLTSLPRGGGLLADNLLVKCLEVVERNLCDPLRPGGAKPPAPPWSARIPRDTFLKAAPSCTSDEAIVMPPATKYNNAKDFRSVTKARVASSIIEPRGCNDAESTLRHFEPRVAPEQIYFPQARMFHTISEIV